MSELELPAEIPPVRFCTVVVQPHDDMSSLGRLLAPDLASLPAVMLWDHSLESTMHMCLVSSALGVPVCMGPRLAKLGKPLTETLCAVCLDAVRPASPRTHEPYTCAHEFHIECTSDWVGPCPLCRSERKHALQDDQPYDDAALAAALAAAAAQAAQVPDPAALDQAYAEHSQWRRLQRRALREGQSVCSFCGAGDGEGAELIQLMCEHLAHGACSEDWDGPCPMCLEQDEMAMNGGGAGDDDLASEDGGPDAMQNFAGFVAAVDDAARAARIAGFQAAAAPEPARDRHEFFNHADAAAAAAAAFAARVDSPPPLIAAEFIAAAEPDPALERARQRDFDHRRGYCRPCPHAAAGYCVLGDGCNFCHNEAHRDAGPVRARATPHELGSCRPCRYAAVGRCRNGERCHFCHDVSHRDYEARHLVDLRGLGDDSSSS